MRNDKIGSREKQLARIEAVIRICEKRLACRHGEEAERLRSRLAAARSELVNLREEAARSEVREIEDQLARWTGNRDPLPQPRRLSPIERVRTRPPGS